MAQSEYDMVDLCEGCDQTFPTRVLPRSSGLGIGKKQEWLLPQVLEPETTKNGET